MVSSASSFANFESGAKDLRIIMVHSGALNINSGGGIHTYELFKNLCVRNKVICLASKSNEIKIEDPNLKYIPCLNAPGFRSISYDFFLAFFLTYLCLFCDMNIIYSRKPGLNLSPALIAKIFRIRYIIELNGLARDDMVALNTDSNVFVVRIAEFAEKLNYILADTIISVTPEIKNALIVDFGIPEAKIFVIENGVDSDIFKPIDKEEAAVKLGLDPTYKYVSFVGGLAPWHGVEYLIDAAPLVLKAVPDTSFLIVGDGPLKNQLIEQVNGLNLSDKFIFTGSIPHAHVPYYINSSDLCTAPFIAERNTKTGLSPLKIYEYLACGRPVVASDLIGVKEIITRSHGGILVEPQNVEDLGQAIVRILKNSYDDVANPQDLSNFINQHHSWKIVAKKTEYVLTNVKKSG